MSYDDSSKMKNKKIMLNASQIEITQYISQLSVTDANSKLPALNALLLLSNEDMHIEIMMQQGLAPRLVTLLGKGNTEEQQLSTHLLGVLIKSKQDALVIINILGMFALIAMLDETSSSEQTYLASRLLSFLDDQSSLDFIQDYCISNLVRLLADSSDEVRLSSITVLDRLIAQCDVTSALNEAGAIPLLVQLIEASVENVWIAAIKAIEKLFKYPAAVSALMDANIVETLLNRLVKEKENDQQSAIFTTLNCCLKNKLCTAVSLKNVSPILFLDFLRSQDRSVKSTSAKMLSELLLDNTKRIEIINTTTLHSLVDLLDDDLDSVRLFSLEALCAVIPNNENQALAIEAGIISILITILSDDYEDELVNPSLQILELLSRDHPVDIANAGVLDTIFRLLTEYCKSANAIKIIVNCSCSDDGLKMLSHDEDIMYSFVNDLKEKQFLEYHHELIRLFICFSESKDLSVVWASGEAIKVLSRKINTKDLTLKESILKIFKNMSDKRDDLADEIIDQGIISPLISQIVADEENVKLLVFSLLEVLSRKEKAFPYLVDTNTLVLLVSRLEHKDLFLVEGSLKILKGFVQNEKSIQPLLDSQTVPKLIKLLLSNLPNIVKENCMSILMFLAEKGHCSSLIISLYGVVPLIAMLRQTSASIRNSAVCLLACIMRDCADTHLIMAQSDAILPLVTLLSNPECLVVPKVLSMLEILVRQDYCYQQQLIDANGITLLDNIRESHPGDANAEHVDRIIKLCHGELGGALKRGLYSNASSEVQEPDEKQARFN